MKKKRVVFTQGGKGGVGKTTLANDLADWYRRKKIPVKFLDFDIENKKSSGFAFFNEGTEKFNIREENSFLEIMNILDDDEYEVMLIDQGAASSQETFQWFSTFGEDAREMGIVFTSIGLITGDPGSLESVFEWASVLQDNTDYLIVKNKMASPQEDFAAWEADPRVKKILGQYNVEEVVMGVKNPDFEKMMRTIGMTAGQATTVTKGELTKSKWQVLIRGYNRACDRMFDPVSDLLLPLEADEAVE